VEPSRARAFSPAEVVEVPEWARYVATDADGAVWAYADVPHIRQDGWWPSSLDGQYELLGYTEPHALWEWSLSDRRAAHVVVLEDCGGHRGLLAVAWLGVLAYVVLEGGRALGWWHW
jgi:hypothetical protein